MELIKKYKECTKCKKNILLEEFNKDKNTKSGYRSHCKMCIKLNYIKNSSIYKERQKTDEYKEVKKQYYKNNREKLLQKNKQFKDNNKEKLIEYRKNKYQNNKENVLLYTKEYSIKNKEKIVKRNIEYQKNRIKNDALYKFSFYTRCNIRSSFKRGDVKYRKTNKASDILGCTIDYFREYIESKFLEAMTFDNYGEWHLDHIIPIATAKNEQDIIRLNHYTNFQPLWAIDNMKKGKKLLQGNI